MITIDSSWICSTDYHLSIVSSTIDTLQCNMNALQAKVNMLSGIIEASNDSVSNQLSAASLWLEIIAIIIAVAGVFLGFYITKKKNQVENLTETVEKFAKIIDEKKAVVDNVAKDAEALDKKIHNSISSLYADLHKEETRALLNRLVQEPGDISNLIRLLLARDMEDELFPKLKEAYLKFKSMPDNEGNIDLENENDDSSGELSSIIIFPDNKEADYILLFFQHYSFQSVNDDEIRPKMIEYFQQNCRLAFKRDIIKSTLDLCKALSDDDSTFNKEDVLVAYLKALNKCKHGTLKDLRNIMEQNIHPRDLLTSAIGRCKAESVNLKLFEIA